MGPLAPLWSRARAASSYRSVFQTLWDSLQAWPLPLFKLLLLKALRSARFDCIMIHKHPFSEAMQ